MRKLTKIALFTLVALFGRSFAQEELPAPSGGAVQLPVAGKLDFAYAGAPIISGDYCSYKFHEEFNTLIVTCKNNEGMLIG